MFFDLSLPEIVVLLGLGVVLFGPEKLPHAAATAARFLQQVRALSDNAREGLRKELGPEFEGLDLKDLNPKAFVRKNLLGETGDLRAFHVELDEDLRSAFAAMDGRLPAAVPQATAGAAAAAERSGPAAASRPGFDEDAT
jgi:sec-independent protein translocase protein TatB